MDSDNDTPTLADATAAITDAELDVKWLAFKARLEASGARFSDTELKGLADAITAAARQRRAIAEAAAEILALQERLVTLIMAEVELPSPCAHLTTAEGLLAIAADSLMSAIAELADDGGEICELTLPVEGNIG